MVFGLHVQIAAEGGDRLCDCALIGVQLSRGGNGAMIILIQIEAVVEIRECRGGIVLFLVGEPQIILNLRVFRPQDGGLAEQRDCFLRTTAMCQGDTEIVQDFGVTRMGRQRYAIALDRIGEVAIFLKRVAEIEPKDRIARLAFDGDPELAYGVFDASGLQQHNG